jgi:hypothetical protein
VVEVVGGFFEGECGGMDVEGVSEAEMRVEGVCELVLVRGQAMVGDCFLPGLSDTCSFSLINQLPTQSVLLIIVTVCLN